MDPNDCEHTKVETLCQYDKQKNRKLFWACPECLVLFAPVGLAGAKVASARAIMEKFVGKVDRGMAKSVETYAEMTEWLEE